MNEKLSNTNDDILMDELLSSPFNLDTAKPQAVSA